ncbi:hypothetical protein CHS0354_039041 [Potamilus streckersoni]|uniref:Hexosyltransferase n=1 Tax=Potamilus streckersoni TaxID=2493646 RepID=A0AAE0RRP4_9BIVA|nr:hypothetical protein CHS0354_039041 [Potamilus streckersoni]
MDKKYLLLILMSASAFGIYLGAAFVNLSYSTKTLYGETIARTTTPLPNVASVSNHFTQLRIEKIRKIYFKLWNNVITSYETKYMIDGKDICNFSSPPFLLFFVLSLPNNTLQRQTIRRTWGDLASQKNSSFNISARMVFMLGRMTDGNMFDRLVQKESTEYNDIVQFDFLESRYNLTRKMMYGLRWVKTYCHSVRYILKVDDDTFINVDRLSDYLLTDSNINNKAIHGYVYHYGGPVLRDGKYAVKIDELPSSQYPPYVSGTSYILPYDAIPDMLYLAERLPYCPVDDAFMTGVMRTILDIKIKHSGDFTNMAETKIDSCTFDSKIAVTNIDTNCMNVLWNLTTQAKVTNCTQYRFYGNNKLNSHNDFATWLDESELHSALISSNFTSTLVGATRL